MVTITFVIEIKLVILFIFFIKNYESVIKKRKEMGEYLKSSSKTVIKVFKELEDAKLIK